MQDKDLWEQEYELKFGEEFGDQALQQTAKTSFKAGWDAAFIKLLNLMEKNNG